MRQLATTNYLIVTTILFCGLHAANTAVAQTAGGVNDGVFDNVEIDFGNLIFDQNAEKHFVTTDDDLFCIEYWFLSGAGIAGSSEASLVGDSYQQIPLLELSLFGATLPTRLSVTGQFFVFTIPRKQHLSTRRADSVSLCQSRTRLFTQYSGHWNFQSIVKTSADDRSGSKRFLALVA